MTEGPARRAERVAAVNAFVKVLGEGGQDIVFQTRDLSANGLFLYTKVGRHYPMIKIGSTMQLELYEFDQSQFRSASADHVRCKVVVVRMVEPGSAEAEQFPTGFGVNIIDLTGEERVALSKMIERIKSEEGD